MNKSLYIYKYYSSRRTKEKKKKKKKLCKRVANKRESYRERFEKKTKMLFNYTYIHVL